MDTLFNRQFSIDENGIRANTTTFDLENMLIRVQENITSLDIDIDIISDNQETEYISDDDFNEFENRYAQEWERDVPISFYNNNNNIDDTDWGYPSP